MIYVEGLSSNTSTSLLTGELKKNGKIKYTINLIKKSAKIK